MKVRDIALVIGFCLTAAQADVLPQRVISADMLAAIGPRNTAWQDCVGADHGGLLLRPENAQQLRLVHSETGFKYIRFHGIFADDTDVYREVDGKPVYDFSKTDAVYDVILKSGMRPLVEVGFMPSPLASDTKTIFYWKGNGNPPKDWDKWSDLISAFVKHLEVRFGADEVRKWRFEVWNEPNLDGFWKDGSQANYFKLYDVTVKAIKGVDAALPVGGPSTAGAAWVPDFLAHAKSVGTPVDFITTHTYGVAGGFLDEKGEGDNKLVADPGSISNDVWNVRKQIQADWPGLPLYITEWSTSYNPRDPIHDDYFGAAYILDKLKKTEGGAQSMSYWTYTDLFEEAGPPPSSFHGGFGLVNREGLRKASFFAYKYLNQLGATELAGGDTRSILTRTNDGFAGLFWDYTTPDQKESNRPFYRKTRPATPVAPVALNLTKLKPGKYQLHIYRTGYKANDAYTQYIEWGMPKDLSPDQVATLQKQSADVPEASVAVTVGRDGIFRKTIAMRTNDVVLVKLERVLRSSTK
jgi:xylan 1,4-beta-xylosidase